MVVQFRVGGEGSFNSRNWPRLEGSEVGVVWMHPAVYIYPDCSVLFHPILFRGIVALACYSYTANMSFTTTLLPLW